MYKILMNNMKHYEANLCYLLSKKSNMTHVINVNASW